MKNTAKLAVFALVAISTLSGCVVAPTGPQGPSMAVLPGTGKTFADFKADDKECRQFASDSIGGPKSAAGEAAKALGITAVGAALGAAVGGAIGGTHTERHGYGVPVNAQTGTAIGVAGGAATAMNTHNQDANNDQVRYDHAYVECMYANHERVPSSAMR
jgi:hypothetical protein